LIEDQTTSMVAYLVLPS